MSEKVNERGKICLRKRKQKNEETSIYFEAKKSKHVAAKKLPKEVGEASLCSDTTNDKNDIDTNIIKTVVKINFTQNLTKLTRANFQKTGIPLSKYLLGKILVRKFKNYILSGRVVETEAYLGEHDKACHAYGGKKTDRTKTMYMVEGTSYVYTIYGMYFCLNISSSDPGGCTLIRALQPLEGIEVMLKNRSKKRKESSLTLKEHQLCNGPSKLCQALDITKENSNTIDMTTSNIFYVVDDGVGFTDDEIVTCKRIGVDGYGEECASKPYRFYVLGNRNVSARNKVVEKTMSERSSN